MSSRVSTSFSVRIIIRSLVAGGSPPSGVVRIVLTIKNLSGMNQSGIPDTIG
jgi:hypothetical protein